MNASSFDNLEDVSDASNSQDRTESTPPGPDEHNDPQQRDYAAGGRVDADSPVAAPESAADDESTHDDSARDESIENVPAREDLPAGDLAGADAPSDPVDPVAAKLDEWVEHMATIGGRDTLLNYRDSRDGSIDFTGAHPSGVAQLLAGRATRLSSLIRDHEMLSDARRRAKTLRAKTEQLRAERGLSAAYLAIGLANWNGAQGGMTHDICAPVLLRPIMLHPRGHRLKDIEVTLADEAVVNPALVRFLATVHDVHIPVDEWNALANRPGSFDPAPVLDRLRKLVRRLPGFTVVQRLIVSTFADVRGPFEGETIDRTHPVIAGLSGEPDTVAQLRDDVARADIAEADLNEAVPLRDRDPESELLVVDADGDQQAAIDIVLSGAHLRLDTPPGTGATQTSVNMTAALAHEGKRVLYVSENADSLDDFIARSRDAGLSDFVLDARGSRRDRQRSLIAMISADEQATRPDRDEVIETLRQYRHELDAHSHALHRRRDPWGVSAYEAMEHLAQLTSAKPAPSTRVRLDSDMLTMADGKRHRILRDLDRLSELGAFTLDVEDTAWFGAYLPSDADAAAAQTTAREVADELLPSLRTDMTTLADRADLRPAVTTDAWGKQIAVLLGIRETLDKLTPDVFDQPLGDMIAATGTSGYRSEIGAPMGSMTRRRLKKLAREFVRPGVQVDNLHKALVEARSQRADWLRLSAHDGTPKVPRGLLDLRERYDKLSAALDRLEPVLEPTPDGGNLSEMRIDELAARLEALRDDEDALTDLPERTELDGKLRTAGLADLVDDLRSRRVEHAVVGNEFELAWWASVLQEMAGADPAVGGHDGDHMRRIAGEFRIADRRHLDLGSDRVRWSLAGAWKGAIAAHPDQAGIVRESLRSKTAELDSLVRRAPDVTGALAPVWLMSPLHVPAELPPGEFFDTVIIGDAGRLSVAEALPAISRARQVVVLGDDRLLGPSTFTVGADRRFAPSGGAEPVAGSLFSELDGLIPTRRLHNSYRNGPDKLVQFANRHFYESTIRSMPAAWPGDESGLKFAHVADGTGAPDPATDQVESVDAEVRRVVQLVLEHARNHPRESLAVVTLSAVHAERVNDLLQRTLLEHPYVGSFFSDRVSEPFTVLDCEHLHGLTRDAIIFSLGFGRTPHGRTLHRMGKLSSPGGERYLAAAITRARSRTTVVSCFTAHDFENNKLAHGAALLPLLLADVAGESLADDEPDTAEPSAAGAEIDAEDDRRDDGEQADGPVGEPDPLLSDLADRLLRRGLYARVNYAGELDLAVAGLESDTGMVVAVESDGVRYRQIRSIRQRERMRPEDLARRGWRYVRVWTTDVFADPQAEADRIFDAWQEAVEDLSAQAVLGAARAAAEVFRRKGERPRLTPGLPMTAYSDDDLDAMLEWIRSDGVERSDADLVELLRTALAQKRRSRITDTALVTAVKRYRAGLRAKSAARPAGERHENDAPEPSKENTTTGETTDSKQTQPKLARDQNRRGAPDPIVPRRAPSDDDREWGDGTDSNDERLLSERPPHWQ